MGVANAINSKVMTDLVQVEKDTAVLIDKIPNLPLKDGMEAADTIIGMVASVYRITTEEGIGLPDFLTNISAVEKEHLDEITVTVKSKLKAWYKVKRSATIKIDHSFVENVANLMTETLFYMYYIVMASENVAYINERIASILEEAGIKFNVKFAVTTDSARVVEITDDTIVIKADIEKALDISRTGLGVVLDEESDYNKLIFEQAKAEFVDVMRTVQITPEIIKKQIKIVEELGDLHTKKHSNKIIREGYHKKAENLTGKKADEVGYFYASEGDKDIFALVSKDGDDYTVVLSPYDAKTNTAVDYDVVGALKSA